MIPKALNQYGPATLALVLGIVMALVLTPTILLTADWYSDWWAENNPPATIEWGSIERVDADTVRFRLQVTRRIDACEMIRLFAYTGSAPNRMRPALSVGREDGEQPQQFAVGITATSKPWILQGIYGDRIAISLRYGCGDHIAATPLLIGTVPKLP
jgi:hypothetical protein